MNLKSLIFAVLETIIKVVVLAGAVMLIIRGVGEAYDFGYRVFKDEPVSANNGRTITVGVAENASVRDVAAMLMDKGLIRDDKLFVVQEMLSSHHGKIRPGIYDLSTGMTANEMLAVMSSEEDKEEEDSDPSGDSAGTSLTEDEDFPAEEIGGYPEGMPEEELADNAPEEEDGE
ncbi:MAG: endolytic transglycosylase MltG [Lachnospiraceae bacterium]|nr:endolytic transglycosylase MltG [Lachnospiraceae bacterium]